ncbi:MAG TPA: hypothetical protein VF902_05655 [Coriobacteriia bacterium]
MNTRIKIAAGVLAGLVAGVTLVGTAFAAPRITSGATRGFSGMMRAADVPGAFDRPTIAEMNAFMDSYRTPSGGIDVGRMRSDVTSGKVRPPCVKSGAATGRGPAAGSPQTRPQRGYGMMGAGATGAVPGAGYGMMSTTF